MGKTKNTKTVKVSFTLDVDVDAWCVEYGMAPGQVPLDVASYVSTVMHELHAVDGGLISLREDNPEPHRGATSEGGLLVPIERLQGLWNELREMYTVLVRTPAPKEMSMGLGWACLAYSRIVGMDLAHVQEYLQAGWTKAPTKPPGVTASALQAPPRGDQ